MDETMQRVFDEMTPERYVSLLKSADLRPEQWLDNNRDDALVVVFIQGPVVINTAASGDQPVLFLPFSYNERFNEMYDEITRLVQEWAEEEEEARE